MSLKPEQREAMELALGLLVTIYDAGYYRDKINEALPRFRAALSQEPEQPAAEGGLRVEWQPIETAPKTSRAILVYCPNRKNTYTVCHGKVGGFLQAEGWRLFGGGGDLMEQPTYWMPLPPPPNTAATDPTKKPDSIDTSERHVDGMDTLAADAREGSE